MRVPDPHDPASLREHDVIEHSEISVLENTSSMVVTVEVTGQKISKFCESEIFSN